MLPDDPLSSMMLEEINKISRASRFAKKVQGTPGSSRKL